MPSIITALAKIWNFELQVLEGSEWVKKQDIELGKGKDDGKQEVSLKTTVTAQRSASR